MPAHLYDHANSYGFDLTDWRPAKAIWLEFSQACPQFAVSGSEQALSKFVRTHKDELHAAVLTEYSIRAGARSEIR